MGNRAKAPPFLQVWQEELLAATARGELTVTEARVAHRIGWTGDGLTGRGCRGVPRAELAQLVGITERHVRRIVNDRLLRDGWLYLVRPGRGRGVYPIYDCRLPARIAGGKGALGTPSHSPLSTPGKGAMPTGSHSPLGAGKGAMATAGHSRKGGYDQAGPAPGTCIPAEKRAGARRCHACGHSTFTADGYCLGCGAEQPWAADATTTTGGTT